MAQIKSFGGKLLVVTSGRQALRLVPVVKIALFSLTSFAFSPFAVFITELISIGYVSSRSICSQYHLRMADRLYSPQVYTVEGNPGDSRKLSSYAVGSRVIYGYGCPAY